jgi:hypothetical protein
MTAIHPHHERHPLDTTTRHEKFSVRILFPDLSDPEQLLRGGDVSGPHRAAPTEEPELDMTTLQVPTRTASTGAGTATTSTSTVRSTPTTERQPVWKHGVAAASFAGSNGDGIPIAGFAQLTLIFSLLGVGLAAVLARKARRPRPTFVRTAVALTMLSYVPDLAFGFDAGSAATLIALHTVAAVIVVPTLAGRLMRTR